ncbi:MAG: hypothetical protein JSR52_02695 [Planctomycetes bacterium]|nr:hypothetical protein [Planctomycetota bacterium]
MISPVSKVEQGPTLVPIVIRNDGQAVPVISPGAEPPFDIVVLSQNEYLRALLDNPGPAPFDLYLSRSNAQSSKLASRLATQIASMPETPANVEADRTLRTEGAKTLKAAQILTNFQQTSKLIENMNKSPEQIIQGMVLDLFG